MQHLVCCDSATDAADIHLSTWVGNVTSLENGYVSPDRHGVPNILTLDAVNGVGFFLPTNHIGLCILPCYLGLVSTE